MRGFKISTGRNGKALVSTLLPEQGAVQVLHETVPVHPLVMSMLDVVEQKGMDLYRKEDGSYTLLPPGILGEDKGQALLLINLESRPNGIVVLSSDQIQEHFINEEGELCARYADLDDGVAVLVHDQDNIGAGGRSAFLVRIDQGASFRISLTGRGEGCCVHRVRWHRGQLNVVSHR